jgi:anti-sigma regulatory factor (Ser/Thr protein kinase)
MRPTIPHAGRRPGAALREDQASPNVGRIGDDVLLHQAFDHSSITALRHAIASCAAAAGLTGDRLNDFVVAINELLTNAVRHGGGRGQVSVWHAGGSVVCEVTDVGPGLPAPLRFGPVRPAADEPGGWGLWLAEELTDTFELITGRGGTTVRVSSRLP